MLQVVTALFPLYSVSYILTEKNLAGEHQNSEGIAMWLATLLTY